MLIAGCPISDLPISGLPQSGAIHNAAASLVCISTISAVANLVVVHNAQAEAIGEATVTALPFVYGGIIHFKFRAGDLIYVCNKKYVISYRTYKKGKKFYHTISGFTFSEEQISNRPQFNKKLKSDLLRDIAILTTIT